MLKQNRLKQKMQDSGGETLIEVLVSILIGALAVFLLFGAVIVSVNLDRKARAADEALKKSIEKAENRTEEAGNSVVPAGKNFIKVTLKNSTESENIENITFYGDEQALSYKLNESAPDAGGSGGAGGG